MDMSCANQALSAESMRRARDGCPPNQVRPEQEDIAFLSQVASVVCRPELS
jgi:hypothetical protein